MMAVGIKKQADSMRGDNITDWLDIVFKHLPRASGIRLGNDSFSAALSRNVLGSVELSEVDCAPLRYERMRSDQLADGCDDFLVSLMLSGRACIEQCGRVAEQGPGDFIVYDSARPFLYDFPGNYHMMIAKIPRRSFLSRLPNAEKMTAISFGGESPLCALASNVMRSVSALDLNGEVFPSAKIGISLVEMFAAAFDSEVNGDRSIFDRQAAILKKAKDYIKAHLDEPDLDVEAIARAVHVSPRTLSRAFSVEGVTVIKWLWQERLAASYATLSEGHVKQVADVAMGCGFVSGSHFSRMFRETYGILPHTMLKSSKIKDATLR